MLSMKKPSFFLLLANIIFSTSVFPNDVIIQSKQFLELLSQKAL